MTARAFVLATSAVISLALGGCALGPDRSPSATPTPTSTPAASAEPVLVFLPDGDAEDNKAFFDRVLSRVATIDQKQPGKTMVNALVRAGFRKKSMQLTPDRTKTDLEADSVIVSVQINRSCLIGQRTNDKKYFSSIETALKTGGCLVGATREIDW